ncbi:MAG: tetratricopeptide repeat protein [Hyphomicrobiaceae bacterium]|nr:tetratricopeptide repeat protein [Hyphomicrobiaceae bacterium]
MTTTGFNGPLLGLLVLAMVAAAPVAAKDTDPERPACDHLDRTSPAFAACAVPAAEAPASDDELFYAAYWLARTGSPAEAVALLDRIAAPDSRVATYLGYAKRKLGRLEEAFADYGRALALDPDNVVARSYLGEAHLERGDVTAARHELDEIERRRGRRCAEYVELAEAVRRHTAARG